MSISVGDRVKWAWGSGHGEGEVVERFTDDVTRTIEGQEITRNATQDEPAFMIKQDDGDRVLKSITEIEKT